MSKDWPEEENRNPSARQGRSRFIQTSGKPNSWLASGQIGFNANLPSVSSFPGTHHFVVLEDSHTLLWLFYFTPRCHAEDNESQKR